MSAPKTRLIGVDCSTDPKKVGLAFGCLEEGKKLVITDVKPGKSWDDIKETVVKWISGSENCLLALDAPLGWPQNFGETLISHKAGCALPEPADQMFDRETDRWIHKHINKNSGNSPFSVGADKIARTAKRRAGYG